MSKACGAALLALLALAMGQSACDPQDCWAGVGVRVTDPSDTPIQGATVMVDADSCRSVLEPGTINLRHKCDWKTDENGRAYIVIEDGYGDCTISVSSTGYEPATQDLKFTDDNQCSHIPVTFKLTSH